MNEETLDIDPGRIGIDGLVEQTKPLLEEMKRLHERRLLGIFPYTITDTFAAQMITTGFYASMISDEGRWPTVTLSACGAGSSDRGIASLDPPVEANAENIAKLAHTVNDWCSLGIAELDGRLVIMGVIPSMSVLLGRFVTQQSKSFASLEVVIRGPGKIDVVCERGILCYNAGIISRHQPLSSSKALGRLAVAMAQRIGMLLGDEFHSKRAEGIDQYLANVTNPAIATMLRDGLMAQVPAECETQLVISELVWRISEMRHGGIVLITDRPDSHALTYKYRTTSGRLQNAVVRYWRAAYEDGYGTSRVPLSHSPGIRLIHESSVLKECVAATAHLAGTDGAIVLGTDFSLHGFGAIIDKAEPDRSGLRFVDAGDAPIDYDSILRNKGSRHQSALSFIMREEGATAFVISQDGHVSVFENQAGVVRCERGLRAEGV